MITLLLSAAIAAHQPTAADCASAYAIEAQRMQDAGELPSSASNPQSLTPAERQSVAAARDLIAQGLIWTALATRTDEDRRAADRRFKALSKSPKEAQAAFKACSAVKAVDRLPEISEPPKPKDGRDECLAEVADMYAAIRACTPLDALLTRAQASQSRLEQGQLTCRSIEAARFAWAQIGSAAAGADSQGQKARCGAAAPAR
jgi:hypothetical protein